jgi:hypothetical protein
VTDKDLIKAYKKQYGFKWFDEFSLNSIVLERDLNVFTYYNMEESSDDIYYWINKQSLKKTGDLYNRETILIAKLLEEP